MNKTNCSNRMVSNRCVTTDGRSIEVGKFKDSGKAFVTRYDVSGTPTDHVTLSDKYTFNAVTIHHDVRGTNEKFDDIGTFDNFVFAVGSKTSDTGIEFPVIIGLNSELEQHFVEHIGDTRGFLNDVIIDDSSDGYEILFSCGTSSVCVDSNIYGGIVIKLPLNGPRGVPYSKTILTHFHEGTSSSFRKIALDVTGYIACVGFRDDNLSDTDFDYIVKYYIGNDDPDPNNHDPFVKQGSVIVV